MPKILSRLAKNRTPLTLAERHHLVLEAIALIGQDKSSDEVEAALEETGASPDQAKQLALEAQAKFDADLVRRIRLPDSAQADLNYYFLLGVTPQASPERIHRAYRRKAKDVHPDRHDAEFARDNWSRLMALISDAHDVLSDPTKRRTYDVVWRQRSKQVAVANRRQGHPRGDSETRYRWEMAELSEMEDEMSELLDEVLRHISEGLSVAQLGARLVTTVDHYEAEILEIRTNAHGLDASLQQFGDTVRYQMKGKERLVPGLQELGAWLADAAKASAAEIARGQIVAAQRMIEEVQAAQHQFDIAAVR